MARTKVELFRQRLLQACDYPCLAVQDAVDEVAAEFGGRAHLLEVLTWEWFDDQRLTDAILVAWASAPLAQATGLSRAGWLRVGSERVSRFVGGADDFIAEGDA